MKHSIYFAAVVLCAGCAHTALTPKAKTEQLVDNILVGDSQHPTCARDEISVCGVTTRTTTYPGVPARERCECAPMNTFEADSPRAR